MIKSLDQDFCCFLFTGLIVYACVTFSCYPYMYFVMCSSVSVCRCALMPLHDPLFIDSVFFTTLSSVCVIWCFHVCRVHLFSSRDISQVSLYSWFLCPLVESLLVCISLSQLNRIQYWNLNGKLMDCITKDLKSGKNILSWLIQNLNRCCERQLHQSFCHVTADSIIFYCISKIPEDFLCKPLWPTWKHNTTTIIRNTIE